MTRNKTLARVVMVGLALLIVPLPAFSQSCALCYTQAASAGGRMIQALRSGILILMAPPMGMSIAITIIAYRRRNKFRSDDETFKTDGTVE